MEDWPTRSRPTTAAPSTSASSASSRATSASCTASPASRRSRPRAGGRAVRRLRPARPRRATPCALSIDIKLQNLVEEPVRRAPRRAGGDRPAQRRGAGLRQQARPSTPTSSSTASTSDNWKALNESLDKPLLNRALRGTYPPGSTYKPFMALAALDHRQAHARVRSSTTRATVQLAATASAATATTGWVPSTCAASIV